MSPRPNPKLLWLLADKLIAQVSHLAFRLRRKLGLLRRLASPREKAAPIARRSGPTRHVPAKDHRGLTLEDRREAWRDALEPLIEDLGAVKDDPDHLARLLVDGGCFDTSWYHSQLRGGSLSGGDALSHYLDVGQHEGLSPHPQIDIDDVRLRIGDAGTDPVGLLLALQQDPRFDRVRKALELDGRSGWPTPSDLRWRDLLDGRINDENTFVLYRIIGNDLPPRHKHGQSERNLRFLLEHEPSLAACEKRFVVNRIIDPQTEAGILGLLEEYEVPYLHIPFEPGEYRDIGWRVSDFQRPGLLYGRRYEHLLADSRLRAIDHSLHDKNLYVMNNNGARNAALRDGRRRARWILPFDGNCFFTADAWHDLVLQVAAAPYWRYLLVPMMRATSNEALIEGGVQPRAEEEPQVAFRADAPQMFDADRRYGRRPKVELLQRLGVPGPWDGWPNEPWEQPAETCRDVGEFQSVSWVARLASGMPNLEADGRRRMISRMDAIRTLLTTVDAHTLLDRVADLDALWPPFATMPTSDDVGRIDRSSVLSCTSLYAAPEPGQAVTSDDETLAKRAIALSLAGELLDEGKAHQAVDSAQALADRGGPLDLDGWLLAALLDAMSRQSSGWNADASFRSAFTRRVEATQDVLRDSVDSRWRRRSQGGTGVWYDIECLSCARFLDDKPEFLEASRRLAGRYHDHFVVLAKPLRRRSVDVELENLLGWEFVLELFTRLGIRLVDHNSLAPQRHECALRSALNRTPTRTDYPLVQELAHLRDDGRESADQPQTVKGLLADEQTWPPLWWLGVRPTPPH